MDFFILYLNYWQRFMNLAPSSPKKRQRKEKSDLFFEFEKG